MAEKRKLMAISTSYGGMTRIRFGGFFPRVGKSRLCGRKVPLSGERVRLAKVRSQGADPAVVAACVLGEFDLGLANLASLLMFTAVTHISLNCFSSVKNVRGNQNPR